MCRGYGEGVEGLNYGCIGRIILGDGSDGWNGIRGGVRLLGLMLLYNGFGPLSV